MFSHDLAQLLYFRSGRFSVNVFDKLGSYKMFKKLSGAKPQGCCKYLPFRLQPRCTSNRHMHADIVHGARDIRITDVDRKKSFLFKDVIETEQELQHKRHIPHGFSECNLVAYHFDLAVLQVFYKHAVHIYVCNCST